MPLKIFSLEQRPYFRIQISTIFSGHVRILSDFILLDQGNC